MEMLARGISYHLQEKAHGGLTGSARRQLDEAARQIAKAGAISDRPAAMQAGTRLARDWHGRTHHVLVLDDGFDYQDRRYGSLSAIARDITGVSWSGPRFFGLLSKRTARAGADGQA